MKEKQKAEVPPQETESSEHLRAQRVAKLAELTKEFGNPFHLTRYEKKSAIKELQEKFKDLAMGEKSDFATSIAGRVMAVRNSGMFLDVLDDSGRMQVFRNLKEIDEKTAQLLKLLDLGDIVGVEGVVRRTPRGELTLDATKLTVLAKALEVPPEKYHGLKDIEFRYRHREQDLVATEKSRETLRNRFRIVSAIRRALDARGFLSSTVGSEAWNSRDLKSRPH